MKPIATAELEELVTLPGGAGLLSMTVLGVYADAVYIQLPDELRRPTSGGCSCTYCLSHPDQAPQWDTLVVPIKGRAFRQTYLVHMPAGLPENTWAPRSRAKIAAARLVKVSQ